MHSTLKLQTNLIIIIACALVAVLIAVLSHPFPTIPLTAGVIFGFAAGRMQSQSIAAACEAFKSAETAMAVRHALASTPSGKRAIQMQWILFPILVGAALWNQNPFGLIAGFAIFMCVRDLVALKAVIGLTQTTNLTE
jgi:hypothetical protein